MCKLIFAFYAIALFSVVGVPAVEHFRWILTEFDTVCVDIVNSPFAYEKYDSEYHFIYTDGIFCPCGLEEFYLSKPCFHGTRGITGD